VNGALPATAVLFVAGLCAPLPGRIQANHARRFGCEARWVRVEPLGAGRFTATGCGFASAWTCADDACALQAERAYGVGGP
jgi:hypothetical protein